MAVEYAISFKTRAGAGIGVFTDFLALTYRASINEPGLLTFEVPADHPIIDELEKGCQIEVLRQDIDNDVPWYTDFYALYSYEERSADDNGTSIFRAYCPGQDDWLTHSIVAYPANTANRSLFTAQPAETALKTLVTRNATASGTTADGRAENVGGWGAFISVEADGAGGSTVTYECANKPLMEALQEVARAGNLDFFLAKTGAQSWEFRTDDTFGDDRSASVKFSLNLGNMRNPMLRRGNLNEKTVAIVGGQGVDGARTMVVRTGSNYDATYNAKEVFVAGTQYATTAGLNVAGDVRLDELRARDDLTWDVIQTPGSLYGKHYFLGDLVTGYFEGFTAIKQVQTVTVTVQPGTDRAETIQVETADV